VKRIGLEKNLKRFDLFRSSLDCNLEHSGEKYAW